jgi:hypothetical protein
MEPDSDDQEEGYVWRTASGVLLRMDEITTSHLENIIRLLWKTFNEVSNHTFSGEIAVDDADREADRIDDRIKFFQAELDNRNQRT